MAHSRVAQRYAEALLQFAEEEKKLDAVLADCTVLQQATAASHELQLFLKSPVIKKEKKQEILTSLFRGKISEGMLHFLLLVVEKGRESLLPSILEEFRKLYNDRKGIVEIHVRTAVPLTHEQEQKLVERFRSYTKKDVRLLTTIDTHILGGFVARYGDTLFDGSVRHQLEILRERFSKEATVTEH